MSYAWSDTLCDTSPVTCTSPPYSLVLTGVIYTLETGAQRRIDFRLTVGQLWLQAGHVHLTGLELRGHHRQ